MLYVVYTIKRNVYKTYEESIRTFGPDHYHTPSLTLLQELAIFCPGCGFWNIGVFRLVSWNGGHWLAQICAIFANSSLHLSFFILAAGGWPGWRPLATLERNLLCTFKIVSFSTYKFGQKIGNQFEPSCPWNTVGIMRKIWASFITLPLIPLEQKLVNYSIQNL